MGKNENGSVYFYSFESFERRYLSEYMHLSTLAQNKQPQSTQR